MDHEERRPLKILPMSVDDMARSSKGITLAEARVLETRLTNLMRKRREGGGLSTRSEGWGVYSIFGIS